MKVVKFFLIAIALVAIVLPAPISNAAVQSGNLTGTGAMPQFDKTLVELDSDIDLLSWTATAGDSGYAYGLSTTGGQSTLFKVDSHDGTVQSTAQPSVAFDEGSVKKSKTSNTVYQLESRWQQNGMTLFLKSLNLDTMAATKVDIANKNPDFVISEYSIAGWFDTTPAGDVIFGAFHNYDTFHLLTIQPDGLIKDNVTVDGVDPNYVTGMTAVGNHIIFATVTDIDEVSGMPEATDFYRLNADSSFEKIYSAPGYIVDPVADMQGNIYAIDYATVSQEAFDGDLNSCKADSYTSLVKMTEAQGVIGTTKLFMGNLAQSACLFPGYGALSFRDDGSLLISSSKYFGSDATRV